MGSRRVFWAALSTAVALLPAAARAATVPVTFGSDLEHASVAAQNCPDAGCTEGLLKFGGQEITAPCTGTITSWAIRGSVISGDGTRAVRLRVLRPAGAGYSYQGVGTSGPITLTGADATRSATTSLAIAKGDHIGVDVPDNTVYTEDYTAHGAQMEFWIPELTDNGAAESPPYQPGTSALNIQATMGCPGHTLTVSRNGTGKGTVRSRDGKIACGASCSAVYLKGTSVTLTASPAANSKFTGWSGACHGTGKCVVTMSSDRRVKATFTKIRHGSRDPSPARKTFTG